jgi:hypothetical protein
VVIVPPVGVVPLGSGVDVPPPPTGLPRVLVVASVALPGVVFGASVFGVASIGLTEVVVAGPVLGDPPAIGVAVLGVRFDEDSSS